MMTRAKQGAVRALADRKGATALEYALVAAVLVAAPILTGVGAWFTRINDFLAAISF